MGKIIKVGFTVCVHICILAALGVAIFYIIFTPRDVRFHVTDAALTKFDLTANNTLFFKLELNMAIRNPNRRIGFYYDRFLAVASYRKKSIGAAKLGSFYQGHKTTTFWKPVFEGSHFLTLSGKDLRKFEEEKSIGIYSVDVVIYLRVKARFGKIKTDYYEPGKVKCHLKVPLSSYHSSSGFKTTKCKSHGFYTDHHYKINDDYTYGTYPYG
ncbi:hypothetical protein L6164_016794 [Bauhinia variegata]|uniref:Uncharacterized protein n=1 Tax=Bauhinia variegata TaxID=167791 RepID=A0ACB9N7R5_BAUVA|nr:hypothetical protein L6164_016794 [Bauhinia variegata]